ncbi:MAG: TerB family tellurite resistance protein [Burkholderiales bacterium]|jgi:hypothetical protein|nr:TerB family tellurite resistance protein [Burkholderiales bacterium]
MRGYPRKSAQAAARIVALTLMADGHVCRSEMQALEAAGAAARLGLPPEGLAAVVQELCEDLLAGADGGWSGTCRVPPALLAALLDEIDAPQLQATVLELCAAVAEADGHLADGESIVLTEAVRRWAPPLVPDAPAPAVALTSGYG